MSTVHLHSTRGCMDSKFSNFIRSLCGLAIKAARAFIALQQQSVYFILEVSASCHLNKLTMLDTQIIKNLWLKAFLLWHLLKVVITFICSHLFGLVWGFRRVWGLETGT